MKQKKPELLAPAGNLEKMKTAFAFGADAVYLGIPDFSLRVRINDFTLPKIKAAIKYAHRIGKKAYVTVNIFAHNKHINKLPEHIQELKKIDPDGIFISDPGILSEIKSAWPEVKLILSTQANCTNWRAARFWQKEGLRRIILARELSLREIGEIRTKVPGVELECFVHGALCMAYSGRCFLSKYYNDRNANLGDCSQPCRWKHKVKSLEPALIRADEHEELELYEEEHGSYILNSRDLCLIKRMPELMGAGIDAFKIEGRAKSVYYLANAVGAYRRVIDLIYESNPKRSGRKLKKELEFLYNELEEKLFNRGYTEGFMFGEGEGAQNLENSHNYPDWEFCGQAGAPKESGAGSYNNYIKVHNTLKIGDRVEIVMPDYKILKMSIRKMIDTAIGEETCEAHGGAGGQTVIIEYKDKISEYSVLRRKIKLKK